MISKNVPKNSIKKLSKHVKKFDGDYFQIGQQYGRIYKSRQKEFFPNRSSSYTLILKKQISVYKKHFPKMLQLIEGISSVLPNYDTNTLINVYMLGEILFLEGFFSFLKKGIVANNFGKCTIFAVKNEEKDVLIGRNYDWLPICQNVYSIYHVNVKNKFKFVAISDMLVVDEKYSADKFLEFGVEDAINEKGLFVGITFSFVENIGIGLSTCHMVQLISESCSSVNEALEIFKKVPLCSPKNYFVADKNGNCVVVEHRANKEYEVRYMKNDMLIQTNNCVHKKMIKYDTVKKYFPKGHNTYARYDEVEEFLLKNKKTLKICKIKEFMTNEKNVVCQNDKDIKTIWTITCDMKNKNYKLYESNDKVVLDPNV